eukprot:6407072-Amphidinium_carterae.1
MTVQPETFQASLAFSHRRSLAGQAVLAITIKEEAWWTRGISASLRTIAWFLAKFFVAAPTHVSIWRSWNGQHCNVWRNSGCRATSLERGLTRTQQRRTHDTARNYREMG